jgi:hypothetical protein
MSAFLGPLLAHSIVSTKKPSGLTAFGGRRADDWSGDRRRRVDEYEDHELHAHTVADLGVCVKPTASASHHLDGRLVRVAALRRRGHW